MFGVAYIINLVINLLILLVLVRAVLTWLPVPPYHPMVKMLDSLTEPLLRPFRKMGRSAAAGFDLSPMILIIVLIIVRTVLLGLLAR